MLTPLFKGVIPPEAGWEAHSLYLVEVAFRSSNPIHQSYLRVGFLNGQDNGPGGYTQIWNGSYEGVVRGIENVYYLKVLKKLHTEGEPDAPENL